jgi:hypothetical protein
MSRSAHLPTPKSGRGYERPRSPKVGTFRFVIQDWTVRLRGGTHKPDHSPRYPADYA